MRANRFFRISEFFVSDIQIYSNHQQYRLAFIIITLHNHKAEWLKYRALNWVNVYMKMKPSLKSNRLQVVSHRYLFFRGPCNLLELCVYLPILKLFTTYRTGRVSSLTKGNPWWIQARIPDLLLSMGKIHFLIAQWSGPVKFFTQICAVYFLATSGTKRTFTDVWILPDFTYKTWQNFTQSSHFMANSGRSSIKHHRVSICEECYGQYSVQTLMVKQDVVSDVFPHCSMMQTC